MNTIIAYLLASIFWLRKTYLTIITFGAWNALGDMCLELGDQVFTLSEKLGKTEYRLDELMRLLELNVNMVIPGHIEPPRLSTFGEGVPIERESQLVEADIKKLQAEKDAVLAEQKKAQLDMMTQGAKSLTDPHG